jgi:Uncharacterized protein conserved in bacteria
LKKFLIALAAAAATLAAPVGAQSFPAKPIKIVMPTPAGSSSDALARMLGEQIQKDTGASVVVENRPGALGTIAADLVARSAPDGYTLHMSSVSTHGQVPHLLKKVPYDAIKDFEHVARLAVFEWLIVADPAKYKSLQDLVAAAKKEPGKLTFAYGTASSLAGVAEFNKLAGIEALGVGYKGQPLALTDVAAGRVDYMLVDVNVSAPMIAGGRLKPLAVAAPKRAPLLPQVPTMAEAGMPAFEFIGWVGLSAPANTPPATVKWISDHVQAALAKPELYKRLTGAAITPAFMPTAEFKGFVASEVTRWGKRISEAGIQPE